MWLTLRLLVILLWLQGAHLSAKAWPSIQDGQLDLTSLNFTDETEIRLQGPWEFYWSQLLEPDDFATGLLGGRELLAVPGGWQKLGYPKDGFGTYRLRVSLPRSRSLAFGWTAIWSASRIYVDGKLISEAGRVGPPEVYSPDMNDGHYVFTPSSPEFDIVIQAASYEFYATGLMQSPKLGAPEIIAEKRQFVTFMGVFIIGGLLAMAIYHFCLYILRPQNRSTLYFGMVCLTASCYMMVSEGRPYIVVDKDLFPYDSRLKTWNLWIVAQGFYCLYVHEIFPKQFSRRFSLIGSSYCFFNYFLMLTFGVTNVAPYQLPYNIFTLVNFFYTLFAVTQAVRSQEKDARLCLIGITILVLGCFHDFLMIKLVFENVPLGPASLFGFVCFQSLLLARRFTRAFRKVEYSEKEIRKLSRELSVKHDQVVKMNENLESLVDEKTREIRSIMTHIQLGIFEITRDDLRIHPDYSSHLRAIFEIDDLTGLEACPLLFASSDLSTDEINVAEQALHACMGGPLLSFDLNSSCFPQTIKRTRRDGSERILDLAWNPIVDEAERIDRMLVTVKDITEQRTLEAEARDKDDELQMIGELINVKPETFRRFLLSCENLLLENRKLLHSLRTHGQDPEILKILFINIHTMKGAARSLSLKRLALPLHEAEDYYVQLQQSSDTSWDLGRMEQDLNRAGDIIALYEGINKEKLGRHAVEEHVQLSESQVAEIYQSLFQMENRVKGLLDQSSLKQIETMRMGIMSLLYRPTEVVLRDICSCLGMLARDLKKAEPRLSLEVPASFVDKKTEDVLHSILVHILRNSMDHGIESPDERVRKGKPEAGNIYLRVHEDADQVIIRFEDDGRGLNIGKLRSLAFKHGIVGDSSRLSVQDCAELIFCNGLSTANEVGDISGRGVGMGAVRQYLRRHQGEIEVHLADDAKAQLEFVPFYFEMRLPRSMLMLPAAAPGMMQVSA